MSVCVCVRQCVYVGGRLGRMVRGCSFREERVREMDGDTVCACVCFCVCVFLRVCVSACVFIFLCTEAVLLTAETAVLCMEADKKNVP